MSELYFSMSVAFIGWLASSYAVKRSSLATRWQRRLIMPLWVVWMAVALGGPVINGSVPLTDALSTGAACMIGMSSSLLIASARGWKRQ